MRLESVVMSAITSFYRTNGEKFFPAQIVLYRDGVSDSQKRAILNHEIPAVKKAIAALSIDCKLTVIMVNKRISTRYFLMDGSNIRNPQPGTFVDRDIVKQGVYDFYLISQRTR